MLPVDFLTQMAHKYALSSEQEEAFVKRFSRNKSEQAIADELHVCGSAFRSRMTGIYNKFSIGGKGPGKYAKLLNFLNDQYRKINGSNFPASVCTKTDIYVERPPIEENCYRTIVQSGALIRIKAPEKMGKSCLLNQILNYAVAQNYQIVRLDLQLLEDEVVKDSAQFLRWLCKRVSRRLKLEDRVDEYWQGMTPNTVWTDYFEENILINLNTPLVLGLDNVDRIFAQEYQTVAANFFGMLRTFWYFYSCVLREVEWERVGEVCGAPHFLFSLAATCKL